MFNVFHLIFLKEMMAFLLEMLKDAIIEEKTKYWLIYLFISLHGASNKFC
jgi:hypothetical protein